MNSLHCQAIDMPKLPALFVPAMTTALLLMTPSLAANALQADLQGAGIEVLATCQHASLVQDAIRLAPDVLVVQLVHDDAAVFEALRVLHAHAPLPVVLFTANMDAAHTDRGLAAGVQEFIFGACEPRRLRPLVHLALARFKQQRHLLDELGSVTQRFEERKLVDRAKGILMSMREMSEPEAFAVLRTAAMQGAMRVGDAARAVIDGARQAADVNRSGQLRMLSQRIVKLQALLASGTLVTEARALQQQSMDRAEDLVASLRADLSPASFGDLLDGLLQAWQAFKSAVAITTSAQGLPNLDPLAEALLQQSENLTAALEHAGSGSSLNVVNQAGRQRMLSQRFAKLALLGAAPTAIEAARQAFVEGLTRLEALPLRSSEISATLVNIAKHWQALQAASERTGQKTAREAVARSSEALLDELDSLTGQYQHSLQVLLG